MSELKKIDMSVLPDGFLIEAYKPMTITRNFDWQLTKVWDGYRSDIKTAFRPALNYWHFNDGSLTLPDGLVVKVLQYCNKTPTKAIIENGMAKLPANGIVPSISIYLYEIVGVKILGVTPDYAEHGAELGLSVVAL